MKVIQLNILPWHRLYIPLSAYSYLTVFIQKQKTKKDLNHALTSISLPLNTFTYPCKWNKRTQSKVSLSKYIHVLWHNEFHTYKCLTSTTLSIALLKSINVRQLVTGVYFLRGPCVYYYCTIYDSRLFTPYFFLYIPITLHKYLFAYCK